MVEKHLILNMSEFKRFEDWIQRWIRQAASQYQSETAPGDQATVWGEFGNSHELPDELRRLLSDKDPHDDSSSEGEINEDEAPQFFSSWVQNIMKPTLDRLEALEKEVIALRQEVAKEKPEAKTKPKKSTSSSSKKSTTRTRKKLTQPGKSASTKRKSSTS